MLFSHTEVSFYNRTHRGQESVLQWRFYTDNKAKNNTSGNLKIMMDLRKKHQQPNMEVNNISGCSLHVTTIS